MIRFSDVSEKGTSPEKIEKHTDIKPLGGMTDQEAEAFWKAEFQKAHDEVSLDEYDSLLYGFYSPSDNTINLNRQYFDNPVELVNTIAHEMRHAYQEYRAGLLETREDALYRVNLDNYISPIPLPGGGWLFFTDYQDQYVEVDARAFANLFTEAMKYE